MSAWSTRQATTIGIVSTCVPASASGLNCAQPAATPPPAAQAGLRPGDKIIAIGGKAVHTWAGSAPRSGPSPAGSRWRSPSSATASRSPCTPRRRRSPAEGRFLGIEPAEVFQRLGPLAAVSYAANTFGDVADRSVTAVGRICRRRSPTCSPATGRQTPAGQVSSVVGVGGITAQVVAANNGWQTKVQ